MPRTGSAAIPPVTKYKIEEADRDLASTQSYVQSVAEAELRPHPQVAAQSNHRGDQAATKGAEFLNGRQKLRQKLAQMGYTALAGIYWTGGQTAGGQEVGDDASSFAGDVDITDKCVCGDPLRRFGNPGASEGFHYDRRVRTTREFYSIGW